MAEVWFFIRSMVKDCGFGTASNGLGVVGRDVDAPVFVRFNFKKMLTCPLVNLCLTGYLKSIIVLWC